MKRTIWLVAAVLAAVWSASAQEAPPDDAPTYVGKDVCTACHADYTTAWQMTTHADNLLAATEETVLGNLAEGAAPEIAWPDGETRPLALDDIDYVITGPYVQKYVTVTPEGYFVLPAMWSIPQEEGQNGLWSPYHKDDWTDPSRDWRKACAGCHVTGLTPEIAAEDWTPDDVEMNVACEACHGPGSAHISAPTEGSIYNAPDPQVCGQCHMVGANPDGEHAYPLDYIPGMALDAEVFVPADQGDAEVWWPTGHSRSINNQYAEWSLSGHAIARENLEGDARADDSCLRCHATKPAAYDAGDEGENEGEDEGSGTAWDLEHAEYGVTCLSCHTVHDPEAAEAESMLRADPDLLCIDCHASVKIENTWHSSMWEMLRGVQIIDQVEGLPSGHFVEMRGVSCTTCHMTPTVENGAFGHLGTHTMMIVPPGETAPDQPDTCTKCHTDLSGQALQQLITGTQRNISNRLTALSAAAAEAETAPGWVQEVIDFVRSDRSLGIHNQAYTDALLYAAELELNLIEMPEPEPTPIYTAEVQDPQDCAECHVEAYETWLDSPHAKASLYDTFLEDFAARGRPGFCMQCHASGYDPQTEEYVFEGVVCSNCHATDVGTEHPPASISAPDASTLCGRCHSGAHAPTYDEWLVSAHQDENIDCVDCHTPHNNGLLLRDVNTTCGSCHPEALVDEVHMGEDMTCKDCHMPRRLADDGIHVAATGHTMNIDPGTCAECHGKTHVLTTQETADGEALGAAHAERVELLESELAALEDEADKRTNVGVVSGVLGTLIVVALGALILRRGRLL